jgi:citrate lyase subunit beta/citryl-CoA lyase
MIFLFVPAHDARKAAKAMQSDVYAVVFDLEAAVPTAQKSQARSAAARYVAALRVNDGPQLWVRVNGDDPDFRLDVQAIDWSRADGAILAQAEDAERVAALAAAGARRIIPLIESAKAFAALPALASVPGVERFAIGTWDLLVDLGLSTVEHPDDSELIWHLRGDLVVASRQHAVEAPIDGIYARLDDAEGFEAASLRARQLGFAGKLVIHPSQIATAERIFQPDPEQIAFANEVIRAYAAAEREGVGAIRVRGQLIDRSMVERARALLSRL